MAADARYAIVLVTCGSLSEGRRIARSVVRKRLAACATLVLGPVQSVYRWKGKVESTPEHLMVIKTTRNRLPRLEREVLRLHSYEVPEFLVIPVIAGSRPYLSWLAASVK